MEKGIDLSFTKSLADFDSLLDDVIGGISSKSISIAHDLEDANLSKFQVGKYIRIDDIGEDEDIEEKDVTFWMGYGWEENSERESSIWIEFDAKSITEKYWNIISKLAGTSGEYCSKIDFKFSKEYMNAWVHFYLKDEYLKQFFNEKVDLNTQKEILTGFVNEVLAKTAAQVDIDYVNNILLEAADIYSEIDPSGKSAEKIYDALQIPKKIKIPQGE
jgi:hypothetical protein